MSAKSEMTKQMLEKERANPNLQTETVSEVLARKQAEKASKTEGSPTKPEATNTDGSSNETSSDDSRQPADASGTHANEEKKAEFSEKHYRIQALLRGNPAKDPKRRVFAKEKNQIVTLAQNDLKPSILFDLCEGCTYTIEGVVSKVFLTECKDCEIIFNGRIRTQAIDVWNCSNVKLKVNVNVSLIQIDASRDMEITYAQRSDFDSVVWAGCDNMTVKVPKLKPAGSAEDAPVEYSVCKCGFDQMQAYYSKMTLDRGLTQFAVQFFKEKLISEMMLREDGGYLIAKRQMDQIAVERAVIEQAIEKDLAERRKREEQATKADGGDNE